MTLRNSNIRSVKSSRTPKEAGKSLTLQSQSKSATIQNIVKRCAKTGYLPYSSKTPKFIDISGIGDLQTIYNRQIEINNYFNNLDADVRSKFDNNFVKMVEFMQDPNNADECIKLGLFEKPDGWIDPDVRKELEPKPEPEVEPNT
jgi:hypothetical protein